MLISERELYAIDLNRGINDITSLPQFQNGSDAIDRCSVINDSAMLLNFSRKCLETSAICSTVSTDGFEVTNLTSDSDRGFMAYSCIKPPVHIDFTLVCDIRIDHLLIWPSVGAQKSSGFEISVKTDSGYKRASTGFLSSEHSGVLFYRRDADTCDGPPNFLRRYMRVPQDPCLDRVKNLRVSILRTDNSVPAIGRVEIWGRVSASSSRETVDRVHGLWRNANARVTMPEMADEPAGSTNAEEPSGDTPEAETLVPECFLDPITCSIMIQPIVLPSGVIIDQSTLEKHGKVEATWGRALSDPFTGIPFSDSRKPIIASALKSRIDKYLVENAHSPEVQRLPRLSGHREVPVSMRNRALDISEIATVSALFRGVRAVPRNDGATKILPDAVKLTSSNRNVVQPKIQHETRVHRLPVIATCFKRDSTKIRPKTTKLKSLVVAGLGREIRSMQNSTLSNLRRFDYVDEPAKRHKCLDSCKCLSRIFYKLPCDHILCRDVLMSIKDSRCADCSSQYDSKDLERIHGHLTM